MKLFDIQRDVEIYHYDKNGNILIEPPKDLIDRTEWFSTVKIKFLGLTLLKTKRRLYY